MIYGSGDINALSTEYPAIAARFAGATDKRGRRGNRMATYVQTTWRRFRAEIGARPLGLPVLKWIAIAIAAMWIAGAGWFQLSGVAGNYGIGSASYRKASGACKGSFSNRYACKSSAIIAGENQAFIDWAVRLAIIFIPPLGLGIVFGFVRRRREEREAEEARRRFRARRRQTV